MCKRKRFTLKVEGPITVSATGSTIALTLVALLVFLQRGGFF